MPAVIPSAYSALNLYLLSKNVKRALSVRRSVREARTWLMPAPLKLAQERSRQIGGERQGRGGAG
jgi:hypothetical protein